MSALDNLVRAREFISDPARWCKGASIIDADGREHLAGWPGEPARCCAYGALVCADPRRECTHTPGWLELFEACGGSPIEFNDKHNHAAVLAAFDRAIAALSAGHRTTEGGAA